MTYHGHNAGLKDRHRETGHLQLQVLHEQVVATILQQLLFEMLGRMQILAWWFLPLTLALHTTFVLIIIIVVVADNL